MGLREFSEQSILTLIQGIQAAPMEPGGWDRFHRMVGSMMNSHVGALYGYNCNSDSVQLVASLGWDAAQANAYAQYYSRRSVTQSDSENVAPGEVYLESMSDSQALAKCQAYNEFFLPLQADHMIVMNLGARPDARTKWGVRRSRRFGPYGEDDVALMQLIHPFLRQSLDVWGQLERMRGLENTLHAALNRLPHGILLLDGRARVLFANDLAETMLAEDDGLLLDASGKLHAATCNVDGRLAKLIGRSVRAGLGMGIHPGGTMAVPRPSMKRPFTLHVFPIPTSSQLLDTFHSAAAIFIADPEHRHRPPHRVLAELYHLSPTEERLACLLMEGLAMEVCAELMGITRNTARSYMKSVFSKTGVSRQGELIQLLFASTLPMPRGED